MIPQVIITVLAFIGLCTVISVLFLIVMLLVNINESDVKRNERK